MTLKKTVITEVGMKRAVKGKSPKEIKGIRSRAAPFYEEFLGGAGPAAPPRENRAAGKPACGLV